MFNTIHLAASSLFLIWRTCPRAERTAPTGLPSDRRNPCMSGAMYCKSLAPPARTIGRLSNRSAKLSGSNRSITVHSSVNSSQLRHHFNLFLQRRQLTIQCKILLSKEGPVGERLHSKSMRRHGLPSERKHIAKVRANTCRHGELIDVHPRPEPRHTKIRWSD